MDLIYVRGFFLHSTFDALPPLLFSKFPVLIPTSIYTPDVQYFTFHIKFIIHRFKYFYFIKFPKKLYPVNIDSNTHWSKMSELCHRRIVAPAVTTHANTPSEISIEAMSAISKEDQEIIE